MPQTGFHGVIGLAAARRIWPGRVLLILGFVMGSLVPDADLLPEAIAQLSGAELPIHRTFSHSLLFAAVLVGLGGILWSARYEAGGLFVALGLGVLGHEALDLLFWFSGINLFWPLGSFIGAKEVNLWRGYELPSLWGNPDLIGNELAAIDAAAFAFYLGYIARLKRGEENSGGGGRLLVFVQLVAKVGWVLFPVYVLTGIFLNEWRQNIIVYAVCIMLFFPTAIAATIAFRRELAR